MPFENDFAFMAMVASDVKVVTFDDCAKIFARAELNSGNKSLRVVVEYKGPHDRIRALADDLSIGTQIQAKGELWYQPPNPEKGRKSFLKLEAHSLQVIASARTADNEPAGPAATTSRGAMPANFFGDSMPS